jgi:MFS family permease
MNAFTLFGFWGLFTWIPAYLSLPTAQGGRGISFTKSTTFFLVLSAGKWFGYIVFGAMSDMWGRKKPYFLYLTLAAILVPIYGMVHTETLLFILGPIVAFFGAGYFSGYPAMAAEIFPGEVRATAMGFSYNAGRIFSATAPFLIGALAVRHGIGPAFSLLAAAFFIAALLTIPLPESRAEALD